MTEAAAAGMRKRERGRIVLVVATALAARLAVVTWAFGRFPPAADGKYYHLLAERLAAGAGYTWLWPDGAVTPVAHYPVGYPGLLAAGYALFGASSPWAMVLGALLGASLAGAAYVAARPWGVRAASLAGLFVALSPALVPYAAALMTEVVAAALIGLATALLIGAAATSTLRARVAAASVGLLLGAATLVRPQLLLLVPAFAWLAAAGLRHAGRVIVAAAVALGAVVVVAPWTFRNCRAMDRCAVVSVNGGWNLLIGAQTTSGAWEELRVPAPCREVWDEAKKDACFEREAWRAIRADVPAALARVPRKLSVTFDYFGGAPWYFHESNAAAFGERAKLVLGSLDLVASRVMLALALVAAFRRARAPSRSAHASAQPAVAAPLPLRRAVVFVVFLVSIVSALTRHAAPGYAGLLVLIALAGPYSAREAIWPVTAAVVASVALIHGVFFGAGRYGLVAAPFVAALAGLVAKGHVRCQDDRVDAEQAIAGHSAQAERREESPSTVERDAG